MSSPVVVLGTMLMGICLILDIIGIATNYWFVVADSFLHAGLFKVCMKVLTESFCESYISHKDGFLNIHYLGTTVCSCLCCLLLFVATVIGFCGCSRHYAKPVVQNIGGVGLSAGVFGTVGFVWYYLYFFQDVFSTGTILSEIGYPGYSFYLTATASVMSLILAITLIIIGCNMQTSNGAVLPQQHQMMVVQNQQQQNTYPQPSAPPQQQMYY